MNDKRWQRYLELPASEEMDSFTISFRINDAIERIPDDVENTLCIGVSDGYELLQIPNSTGLEINKSSLEKCEEKGFNVVYGDMHEIPFDDKSFDLVYSRHSLEHSIATWIAMSEFARIAKKYILIVLPDQKLWGNSDWHFLIPTLEQLQTMAKKLGFEIIDTWHNDLSKEGMSWAVEDGYLLKRK